MAARCSLVVVSPRTSPELGRIFPLDEGTHRIGRHGACEVQFDHESISRFHATLTVTSTNVWLEDSNSTNGTLVNGEPCTRHPLQLRDQIALAGRIVLQVAQTPTEDGDAEVVAVAALLERDRHDLLTGVLNRSAFLLSLEEHQEQLSPRSPPFALLLCDVDHLKRHQDTQGINVGDAILWELGRRLQRCLPRGVVGRVGGEEFALLVPGVNAAAAIDLAETIRRSVEHPVFELGNAPAVQHYHRGPMPIAVTVSLGVLLVNAPNRLTGLTLLQAADEACREAKQQGRNRVVLWSP